jgi:hypothetical protein
MEHARTTSTEPGSTEPPANLLFSLPPHVLWATFLFVGAENFRRDVRWLTISRRWYYYAMCTFLRHLRVGDKNIVAMLDYTRPPLRTRLRVRLAAFQKLTKAIDLDLKLDLVLGHDPVSPDVSRRIHLEHYDQLASTFKTFSALRALTIRSSPAISLLPPCRAISSFAGLSQLTSLELNLMEMPYFWDPTFPFHLCEFIPQHAPNLKTLRCHFPTICEKLLEWPYGTLEELIISIRPSDYFKLYGSRSAQWSTYISYYRDEQASLETEMLQFAASRGNLKVVRLIYDYNDETHALDAMGNRRLLLTTPPAWDEDGVLLPEGHEDN